MTAAARDSVAGCDAITNRLDPDAQVTAWVDLHSQHDGQSNVVGTFSWNTPSRQASNLPALAQAVSLSPIVVHGRLYWWGTTVDTILKDLALPFIVGLVGFMIQQQLQKQETQRKDAAQKREEARQEHEKKLEHIRRDQDFNREQLAQTWTALLPISHRYATEYYAGLAAAAGHFALRVSRYYEKGEVGDAKKAFFNLFVLYRRRRHLAQTAGAYYFKTRIGEEIVVRALSRFHELYFNENLDAERALSQCLNQMTIHETLDDFLVRLETEATANSRGPFTASFEHLIQWLKSADSKTHLEYVQLYECILTFEMNRPYQYWYVHAERLEISDVLVARLKKLGEEVAETSAISFHAGLEGYLREAKSETSEAVSTQ